MNVYSKFGLNILTMKDLRQFFLPPVKFQKVQIVPSGSNTSICLLTIYFRYLPAFCKGAASEWMTSTNIASVGSRRTTGSVLANSGPAGSRPER